MIRCAVELRILYARAAARTDEQRQQQQQQQQRPEHPMDTATTLQQLLDLEAIKTLKHRYVRAMTTSRWDLLESVLSEDIQASYSDGKYVFDNRADLLRFLSDSHDASATHILGYWHVTMPEISFDASDHALGTWAMYHFFLDKREAQQLEMFAYYHDEYRRQDGEWRICRTGYRRVMEQSLDRNTLPGLQLLVG